MDPVFVCRDLGGVALLGALDAVIDGKLATFRPDAEELDIHVKSRGSLLVVFGVAATGSEYYRSRTGQRGQPEQ